MISATTMPYFLYRKMPEKRVFLQRMVAANPAISREFYLRYARHFGIERADITRILAYGYCDWAFMKALDRGWIDESLRGSVMIQANGPKMLGNRKQPMAGK